MATKPFTLTTAAQAIAEHNNRRTSLSFRNLGTVNIFVAQDENAIATRGYPIAAGGSLDLIRALGDEPQTNWFGVSASGTVDTRILEAFGELPILERPTFLGT